MNIYIYIYIYIYDISRLRVNIKSFLAVHLTVIYFHTLKPSMDNQKDDSTKCVSTVFEKLWKGRGMNSKIQNFVKNGGAIFEQVYELSVTKVCTATLAQVYFQCLLNFTIFHKKCKTDRCQIK